MRARYSNYPIGNLLLNVINQSGLDPKAFFEELKFTNFSKAIERLDGWLDHGEGNVLLLERLQSSRFAIETNLLKQVMAENDAMLQRERDVVVKVEEDKARKAFQPHLDVIPELSRPTQITPFCLTGGNRRFSTQLPDDISSWPQHDQLAYLRRVVPENFAKHQGRTFFMGKIVGYLYYPRFDSEPIQLTITGDLETQSEPLSYGISYFRFR
ncbi:hypothetical protein WQE_23493 [Paraburkholderia hospita]|uniref:Uncharacterized protein n=1 Tax=Paraburkholderia hospita TaxID=169430 RepID=A0ABP2PL97_9BURK|nr:hypothetical protein [Paraburkholderia hospita]EIM98545.1 hypothetical protein WQE_23493 [Paraburkholderia hospita]OUL86629.1 hypothetical protein CA602_15470 [Paraburkholderia hospita]